MASQRIRPEQMAKAIGDALETYSKESEEKLIKAYKKIGSEARKEVQAESPKRTGAYSKDWAVRSIVRRKGSIGVDVYNRTHYQLTHLLEYGHKDRGGGQVKAYPHIWKVQEKANKKAMQAVKEAYR